MVRFGILFCVIISYLTTFFFIPVWIRRAKKAKLTGLDMHKAIQRPIPEMGGITVIAGFVVGIFFYIGFLTFRLQNYTISLELMAILTTILLMSIIGIFDDLLGWKIGIRQRYKPLLTIIAAIPLLVLNAGHSIISLPFLGNLDIGLFYPFFVVPIAVVGVSNAFNMIGGFNGLESGLGVIILSTMGFIAYLNGDAWTSTVSLCMILPLLAFLYFNSYPAKIFPGDTLTYPIGALIAVLAVLGNMEKVALILFIPYFIEFFLKLRGGFIKESFGRFGKNGLELRYKGIYGLEHIAIYLLSKIRKHVHEREVVYLLYLFQLVFSFLAVGFYLSNV